MLGPPLDKLEGLPRRRSSGVRLSSFLRPSTPVRLGPFVSVICRGETQPMIERATELTMLRPSRELIETSYQREVSRSARRFRVLHFLLAAFHRQVPPVEPSLLDRCHPSSYFEINRDRHLQPLAGDNRQSSGGGFVHSEAGRA